MFYNIYKSYDNWNQIDDLSISTTTDQFITITSLQDILTNTKKVSKESLIIHTANAIRLSKEYLGMSLVLSFLLELYDQRQRLNLPIPLSNIMLQDLYHQSKCKQYTNWIKINNLHQIAIKAPLLNGKEISTMLQIKGKHISQCITYIRSFTYLYPNISKDQCIQWLLLHKEKFITT